MPEANPTGTAGLDPNVSDPPAGTEGTPQDGASDGSGITDVVVLQKELAKVRREAAENRVKLKAFEDVKAESDKAQLTEQQRTERRAAELEQKLVLAEAKARTKALEAAVAKAATKLGIVDPDAAVKLLDAESLELDDDGEPKNIDVALKALVKERPWLASKPETPTPGSVNGAAGGEAGPPPKLTADELAAAQRAGMTPERYEKLKGVKTLDDWKKAQPPAK